MNWASESVDAPLSIYWMRGSAGVGKSTTVQTGAEKLKETGHLGATFFFTVKKHHDSYRLVSTIAYQPTTTLLISSVLTRGFPRTRLLLRRLSQFKSLNVEPLQELEKQRKGNKLKAVLIYGLDEGVGEDV